MAYDFLIEFNTNNLPFDPFQYCKKLNINIRKITDIAKELNVTRHYAIRKYLYGGDGLITRLSDTDEYVIAYDDTVTSKNRIRFTIAHEIGHFWLGHLDDTRTNLSLYRLGKNEYQIFEQEANCFAGIVLAPPPILNSLNIHNSNSISNHCHISLNASTFRIEYMKNHYVSDKFLEYENIILNNFSSYLFIQNNYYCYRCKGVTSLENSNFCLYCGNEKIKKNTSYTRSDSYMIYKGLQVDDISSKAKVCPTCSNEETSIKGGYCHICGTLLINKCTNQSCSELLPGNARFCYKCGKNSTFFDNNLLLSWQYCEEEVPF